MKFNLKKFPITAPYSRDKLQFAHNYIDEVKQWKTSFEKEIRQAMNAYKEGCCNDEKVTVVVIKTLEEILGEIE